MGKDGKQGPIGQSFDEFLAAEGLLDEVRAAAALRNDARAAAGEAADLKTPNEETLDATEWAFLDLLDDYIWRNPERLIPMDEKSVAKVNELIDGVEVDLDECLPVDDDEHDT